MVYAMLFENHVSFEGNEALLHEVLRPHQFENHVSFEGNEALRAADSN